MLSPAWPPPTRIPRPALPPRVRRRVAVAERRAMRRAVTLAAVVVSLLLLVDLGVNLAIRTPGTLALAPFEIAAAAGAVLAGQLASRGAVRSEWLGAAIVLSTFGVALLGLSLTPDGRMLGAAQLAIILVGTGLFLPWSLRWHLGAMAAAMALTVAFVASPLNAMAGPDDGNLVAAVVMAAVTSAIGHSMWQSRLRALLSQQFALRHLSRYAQRQEAHVSELNRELNLVARRDALTGVGNRLALDEALARLLDHGDRVRPMRFALVLFDIDHFKAYNDEHGHLAGDAALGRLGEVLRRATRGDDLSFRYGGEEFLILLPDIDLSGAIAMAERVRVAVADDLGGLPPFTVSGGVALCDPADGRNPEPILRRADAALYLAKRAGRNRIAADELSVAMQRQEIATAG